MATTLEQPAPVERVTLGRSRSARLADQGELRSASLHPGLLIGPVPCALLACFTSLPYFIISPRCYDR